jgi:hypothetical protein
LRLIIHNLDVAVRDKDGIPSHLKMMRKHNHNPMVTITSGKRRQSENSCYPTASREFTIEPNVWKCRATVMGHPKIGHDTPRNMARINTAMGSKTTKQSIHPSSTLSGNDDIGSIANYDRRRRHTLVELSSMAESPTVIREHHATRRKIFCVDPPEDNSGLLTFRALARAHSAAM